MTVHVPYEAKSCVRESMFALQNDFEHLFPTPLISGCWLRMYQEGHLPYLTLVTISCSR